VVRRRSDSFTRRRLSALGMKAAMPGRLDHQVLIAVNITCLLFAPVDTVDVRAVSVHTVRRYIAVR